MINKHFITKNILLKIPVFFCLLICIECIPVSGQLPLAVSVDILQAEDERYFSPKLALLLKNNDPSIRKRAVLAAGRIGDVAALNVLEQMLRVDKDESVREMAAFAIGEIESIKSAEILMDLLRRQMAEGITQPSLCGRIVEAAGKIAAANPKEKNAADLANSVAEFGNAVIASKAADRDLILLTLTALLRSKPPEAENIASAFLAHPEPRVRADAANVLARLRSKKGITELIKLLETDTEAIVRANAARALGAAGEKAAEMYLLEAATNDTDLRVRVSAIRSLGLLNSSAAAQRLLEHAEKLLVSMKESKERLPAERNELLEIFPVLGKLFYNSKNERAAVLLEEFARLDNFENPEPLVARIRIIRGRGTGYPQPKNWRQVASMVTLIGEFSTIEPVDEEDAKRKALASDQLRNLARAVAESDPQKDVDSIKAGPEILRAFARFNTTDLPEILRLCLKNKDIFVRATAADLLADLPASQETASALRDAVSRALKSDYDYNDAQLALLDALHKTDPNGSFDVFCAASNSVDYLVRKKAIEILSDSGNKESCLNSPKPSSGNSEMLEVSKLSGKLRVFKYKPGNKTKQGQILNSQADYYRAARRKNGTVRAEVLTEKGTFFIDFFPEEAPLTVENFIKLARRGYFNGVEIHRVVPNFVMQDGDPRGDGNGGPGWSIRCEINTLPYERGIVGMALSGKDTGGSQWFVTHSPQPHLDGGYTVFGRIDEAGMKIVDSIVRGDKILKIIIHEKFASGRLKK